MDFPLVRISRTASARNSAGYGGGLFPIMISFRDTRSPSLQVSTKPGQVQSVQLGVQAQVPARLLALPVPPELAAAQRRELRRAAKRKGQMVSRERLARADWTIMVTNVPAERLSLKEARSLYRARWQIELLFKRWKQDGRLATSRSHHAVRIQAELFAKLIGQILQHWLVLLCDWRMPDKSLTKAGQVVRDQIRVLAAALDRYDALCRALVQLQRCLRAGTRLDKRRKRPSTSQLLLDSNLEP